MTPVLSSRGNWIVFTGNPELRPHNLFVAFALGRSSSTILPSTKQRSASAMFVARSRLRPIISIYVLAEAARVEFLVACSHNLAASGWLAGSPMGSATRLGKARSTRCRRQSATC